MASITPAAWAGWLAISLPFCTRSESEARSSTLAEAPTLIAACTASGLVEEVA
eukprot:CAMPEP_0185207332 /NCGR_PEP_ID=MMETSP1140-20130426/60093_1 /TAXON_ID=298111 /ORGANISM="Pavlova sp., Strain CCMP459" /LENGTH=52 /DNA_ID=CAMNT_0027775015 /DNA_START=64 /DNA_END=218 /DNA_ORIENTATION=-